MHNGNTMTSHTTPEWSCSCPSAPRKFPGEQESIESRLCLWVDSRLLPAHSSSQSQKVLGLQKAIINPAHF